jgi:8-amino-7-oxononanoate synthase
MISFEMTIKEMLEKQKSRGRYRTLRIAERDRKKNFLMTELRTSVADSSDFVSPKTGSRKDETPPRELLSFSSNDYLGLSIHDGIKKKVLNTIARSNYPAGTAASPLIRGYFPRTRELEKKLAKWKEMEEAILFPSGFQANFGLIRTLSRLPNSFFITDELIHASLIDGMPARQVRRYHHLDYEHLEKLLKKLSEKKSGLFFVVSDGLFSMDGDFADLNALSILKNKYPFTLIIDDAHGTGVLGKTGIGLSENQEHGIDILTGNFSKAIGGQGGFILCRSYFKEFLVNYCRSYIYSTALNPYSLEHAWQALDHIQSSKDELIHLRELIGYFLGELKKRDLEKIIPDFENRYGADEAFLSPIFPVFPGGNVMDKMNVAMQNGFYLVGIRPPTVPVGTERFRISLSALHTKDDIDKLVNFLDFIRKK